MTDAEFDQVIAVHIKGAYSCTKAAWPHFRNQKFGRIINTASAAGIYGGYISAMGERACHLRLLFHRKLWPGELQRC